MKYVGNNEKNNITVMQIVISPKNMTTEAVKI